MPETCEELKRDLSDQDVSNPFTQVREPLPWRGLFLGIEI